MIRWRMSASDFVVMKDEEMAQTDAKFAIARDKGERASLFTLISFNNHIALGNECKLAGEPFNIG